MTKRAAFAVIAAVLTPVAVQAQDIAAFPGFYVGAGGGISTPLSTPNNASGLGWVAGGKIGYDFVGPRIDLDVGYGQTPLNVNIPGTAINGKAGQLTSLINVSYDFFPTSTITPYVGAGAGVAFIDSNTSLGSTQFAWDALVGVRYNITNAFAVGLEARYVGTTNPSITVGNQTISSPNQNFTTLLGFAYKFGAPAVAAAPPQAAQPQAPSFMVFFDWDRSNLSAQALNTIKQAAGAYKTKGSARMPTTWRCRCVVRTRSRTLWCAKACRRRRSRSSARARPSRWCRPPMASASRRTAASRS
jgi:OOP family OmpA-OmpF porin